MRKIFRKKAGFQICYVAYRLIITLSVWNSFTTISKMNYRDYIQITDILRTRFASSCRFFVIRASYGFLDEVHTFCSSKVFYLCYSIQILPGPAIFIH